MHRAGLLYNRRNCWLLSLNVGIDFDLNDFFISLIPTVDSNDFFDFADFCLQVFVTHHHDRTITCHAINDLIVLICVYVSFDHMSLQSFASFNQINQRSNGSFTKK